MSAPDFVAALARAVFDSPLAMPVTSREAHGVARNALQYALPELCQARPGGPIGHACPDCPTIGQLLAIGAAVMNIRAGDHPGPDGHRHGCSCGAAVLAQLRAVQP